MRYENQKIAEDWQPIETAPKDGTIIDLRTKSGAVCHQEWWIEDGDEAFWSCDYDDLYITHWRPNKEISP